MIRYYAGLLRWDYIVSPLDFDKEKAKPDTFRKQYIKVQNQLELMNLKHELNKATEITLRDGILYTGGGTGNASGGNGRPVTADEDLDAAGEATRANDTNANR